MAEKKEEATMKEIFDFPVERVPSFAVVGGQRIPLDKDAIFRTDTLKQIGTVSAEVIHRANAKGKMEKIQRDYYKIVQHAEVVNAARTALHDLGMKPKETTHLLQDGGRLLQVFDFPNEGVQPAKGDFVSMRLTVINSYDLSRPVGFELGGLRLVCTNGLVAFRKAFYEMRKHSGSFDLEQIVENMKKATETFHMEVLGFYKLMGDTPLSVRTGTAIIHKLVENATLPEKYGEAIEAVWQDPDAANSVIPATDAAGKVIPGQFQKVMTNTQLDHARTVWAFYNAFTLILTHYVASLERRALIHQAVQSKIAALVRK
jgi:hypothetical protein